MALAIMNLLGGVILLGCGVWLFVLTAMYLSRPQFIDLGPAFDVLAGAMALGLLLAAVGMVIAAVGLLKRRRWGRTLTLVFGGVVGYFALGPGANLGYALLTGTFDSLFVESAVLFLVCGGYCAVAYAILLNKRFAAEFRLQAPSRTPSEAE
jgi:hypothetical protein